MKAVIYPIHSLLRRHLALLERLLTAAGLAAIFYGILENLPAYPANWGVALTGAIFVLTFWSPVAGYFTAILAASYPIYTISLYLAVLFLAVAIIGQHIFIQNLGGTLLTSASPLLGSVYLAWGIPVLGGLWWGPAGGALMGAMGALWGLLVAGFAGLTPDWVTMLGILPGLEYLSERFARANSFETIGMIFAPLAPNSAHLLYITLQVAAWAFTGWLVGMLNQKEWAQRRRPQTGMTLALGGALALSGFHILISLWLGSPISSNAWFALGMTTLFSALAVILLEAGQDFLEHPLPMPRGSAPIHLETAPYPAPTLPLPPLRGETPASIGHKKPADDPDDLIMLELD